jgi:3-hydroxymyristoyl/3-hydroxydecanoyl-(acyl carrier protein) dehydratase
MLALCRRFGAGEGTFVLAPRPFLLSGKEINGMPSKGATDWDYGYERIRELLPFGDDFLLVETATVDDGVVTATMRMKPLEKVVAAHFPSRGDRPAMPIVPGTLLVEAAAQTSLLLFPDDLEAGVLPLNRGFDEVKFHCQVGFNCIARIEARVVDVKNLGSLKVSEIEFEIRVGDKIAANGFIHGVSKKSV